MPSSPMPERDTSPQNFAVREVSATAKLPQYADGVQLSERELLGCRNLAHALREHPGRARAAQAGHRASLIKGRGMEFAEVRQYQNGDDVRTIDWRVTARTGQTHTKLFVEERERPIILLLDLSHSLYFGSSLMLQSVQAGHLAATLGWSAINQGDRLGALIASEHEHLELKPRSRRQGILQLISALTELHRHRLAQFSQTTPDPDHILRACQRLRRIAKPGSLVRIITDGSHFDDSCLAPLSELGRHCELDAFLITDPLRLGTLELPRHFTLPVREGNTEKLLDRRGYDSWLAAQQSQLASFVALMDKLKVRTRLVDAGLPLSEQLEQLR
jgi:uncharacterized protein (DUF58 family)